jgi:3-oxoacyl-[acyl-carrier-protein] synthase-3
MWPHHRVQIVGTGSYVPEKVLTNNELEKMVDTSDEWILTRTGIRDRRIASPEQASSDLAYEACVKALDDAGLAPADVDLVMVSTITPDRFFPSTACTLQTRLGLRTVGAFDISAACSGFVYGLAAATGFISAGVAETILVVGAEVLSKVTNYTDRTSCILFGDGAGAAVLQATPEGGTGSILHLELGADGEGGESMIIPAGGSRIPTTLESASDGLHYMKIRGREVFKFAVSKMRELIDRGIRESGLKTSDVALVIPHQSNARIVESAVKKLEIPMERVYLNIDRLGNTSAASIPLALDEAHRSGLINRGDYVVLVAFGGGLTWAGSVIRF